MPPVRRMADGGDPADLTTVIERSVDEATAATGRVLLESEFPRSLPGAWYDQGQTRHVG